MSRMMLSIDTRPTNGRRTPSEIAPTRRRAGASRRHSRARWWPGAAARWCGRHGRSRRRSSGRQVAGLDRLSPTGRPPARIGFGMSRRRVDAVERRTRAGPDRSDRPRREICRMSWRATPAQRGSMRPQRLEFRELHGVGRILRLVGAGEMAHHQPDRDAVESARRRGKPVDLAGRHAKPRHAAVDLQRRGQLAPGPFGNPAPGRDLLDAVQHRNETGLDAGIFRRRVLCR